LFPALRSSVQNCEVKTRIHKCIADSEKQIKDIEKVVLTDLSFRHIYVYVH
jgi:ferritin-like metal-binding protein YciE